MLNQTWNDLGQALAEAEAEVSRCCSAVDLASTPQTRAALTAATLRLRAVKDDIRLAGDYAQRLLDEEREQDAERWDGMS